MKKLVFGIAALALGSSLAWAGPAEDREVLMKERGKVMGVLTKMVKGEAPFDAAVALEQLKTLQANAEKVDVAALWPEGSGGGETESSPKIWEDMAGFTAQTDKFKAAATAAAASAPADVAALQATVGAVGKECGACHEVYRIKKN
jgi:cytochrome c556